MHCDRVFQGGSDLLQSIRVQPSESVSGPTAYLPRPSGVVATAPRNDVCARCFLLHRIDCWVNDIQPELLLIHSIDYYYCYHHYYYYYYYRSPLARIRRETGRIYLDSTA